ncbi:MAG: MFS transporter, partial [Candidatus Bathyarchaeia archaeon]
YVGRISDLWSKKKISLVCNLFSAILTPLYVFSKSFISFVPLHLTVPALYWTYESICSALAVDIAKTGKVGTNLGILRTSALGWSIGSLFSGFIIQNFGFETAFVVISILYFWSAFLVSQLTEAKRDRFHLEEPSLVLKDRHIIYFLLIVVVAFSTMPAFHSFLPLYMKNELKAPESVIPLIFAITPLGEIPLTLLLGRLADRIDRRKIILICFSAFPIRWAAIVSSGNYVLVILVQMLHGLAFAGLYVAAIAYLSDMVTSRARGMIVGAFSSSISLGTTIGGYALGFTAQNFGFKTMYLQAIATSTVAVLSFATLGLGSRKSISRTAETTVNDGA